LLKQKSPQSQPEKQISSLPPIAKDEQDKDYGSFTAKVMAALGHMPSIFTRRDVTAIIGKVNENTLYGCLFRLEKQGIIEKVEQGKGRAPSKYRLKKTELGFD
jgi:DNA-binding HxlR family transcriptional regulator